jgi:hypothetical protein
MDEQLLFGEMTFSQSDTAQNLKELQKALTVGYEHGVSDQVGFGAPRISSLESTLKWVSANEKTATFWPELKKSKGKSTIEEFASLQDLGQADSYLEGGLPNEYNEVLKREFEATKYVGAVGSVTYPATVIDSIVDAVTLMTRAKATAIVRSLDVKCFFANSANISTDFNGFLTQFYNRIGADITENVIDKKGSVLTPEDFNLGGQVIQSKYGDPKNLRAWIAPEAFKGYTDGLIANKQYFVGNNDIRSIVASAKKFELSDAEGRMTTDVFLRHKGEKYLNMFGRYPSTNSNQTAFAAVGANPPATLSAPTATVTPTADASSTLTPATYDYAFVPISPYGAGVAFEVKNNQIQAGQNATFALADNGTAAPYQATAFDVYRRLSSSNLLTDYHYVDTYALGAPAVDDGSEIPDTTYAFMFDWNFDQVLDFKQLLPMVKMPLPIVGDQAARWLQKLYGTPILYNPKRVVVFKNVGSKV